MYKRLKRFISVLLVSIITFSLSISAFASDLPSENTVDSILLNRGYPKIVLDTMEYGAKLEIYNDPNLYFAGSQIIFYNDDVGEFETIDIDKNSSVPYSGQIPSSNLSLNWTTSIRKYSDGSYAYLDVKYSYNWTKLPIFRWQDSIAIGWDSSIFRLRSGSFYKVDLYDGYMIDMDGNIYQWFNDRIKSEEYGYANAGQNFVSWYADLKGYTSPFEGIQKLHGYASFILDPVSANVGGLTNLYGHYVHPTVSANLSVSYSGSGSFSVTGLGQYDERGNDTSIIWR